MSQTIYLDNAATTPLSEQVLEEMMPYLKDSYGNPSSVYDLGVANKSALLTARKRIAKTLNCANPQNIYFTSGGTESDNWAIIGTAEQCKKNGNHIITSKIEHHAVLNTCAYLEEKGFEITYLDVDEQGFIKPEKLLQALRKDTILVSIMTANNEIGTIQAIPELASLVKANSRAVFHTDAVQAYGQIPIDITKMNVDLLSASAHKFYGPKGVGFLYIREGVNLPSFHHGGKQESGLRAGTENVPALVGMGKAAQLVNEILMEKSNMMSQLRDYMIHRIEQEIPYCHLNGSRRKRLPNNINISFSFVDGETIEKKKAQREAQEKRAEEKKADRTDKKGKTDGTGKAKDTEKTSDADKVTVSASSWEELLKKIDNVIYESRADSVMTKEEKAVGQSFDYSI